MTNEWKRAKRRAAASRRTNFTPDSWPAPQIGAVTTSSLLLFHPHLLPTTDKPRKPQTITTELQFIQLNASKW